jgi:hypothetical protein
METPPHQRLADKPSPSRLARLASLAVFLGLVTWNGWLTLSLFGPDRPVAALLDSRPLVSGSHPLHLYHGTLGAQALWAHGSSCCYDPNFQAGYPKTPIFDGGSRPAELFLLVAGGEYRPEAYKVGLAVCCLLAPVFLLAAAWGFGLRGGAACLVVALGLGVWWGQPAVAAWHAGDLDVLLAGLAVPAQLGMLAWFDRDPGLRVWLGLVAANALCWFAHPFLGPLLLPAVLVYYLSVGHRHGLFWHAALGAGIAVSLAFNAFWLIDWVTHWYLLNALTAPVSVLAHRTFRTVWEAELWGDPVDRGLAVTCIGLALLGIACFNSRRQRVAARLLGLGGGGLLVLALLGITNESTSQFGTARLLLPGLLALTVPAGHAIWTAARPLLGWLGCRPLAAGPLAVGLLALGWLAGDDLAQQLHRSPTAPPLPIGLERGQEAALDTLRERTTTEARVLWEDGAGAGPCSRWTALLPVLTGRVFVGGLDLEAGIAYAQPCLNASGLAGNPLAKVSDDYLTAFCERYNIGWVVCSSPAARQRFLAWPGAGPPVVLDPATDLCLVPVRRASFSYLLNRDRGARAEWLGADCERIALGNVVPDANGEVLLSLHYQTGLRASPGQVKVEKVDDQPGDIPFLRLRMPGPTTCVTLTWDRR